MSDNWENFISPISKFDGTYGFDVESKYEYRVQRRKNVGPRPEIKPGDVIYFPTMESAPGFVSRVGRAFVNYNYVTVPSIVGVGYSYTESFVEIDAVTRIERCGLVIWEYK